MVLTYVYRKKKGYYLYKPMNIKPKGFDKMSESHTFCFLLKMLLVLFPLYTTLFIHCFKSFSFYSACVQYFYVTLLRLA